MRDEDFEQCTKMIQALKNGTLAEANASCGLHVHVGDGNKGFDLRTVKVLWCGMFLWEEAIETLIPHFRRGFAEIEDANGGKTWKYFGDMRDEDGDEKIQEGEVFCKSLRRGLWVEGAPCEWPDLEPDFKRIREAACTWEGKQDSEDLRKVVLKVLGIQKIETLVRLAPEKRTALSLRELNIVGRTDQESGPKKLPVEFRQQGATLDPKFVRFWMRFCTQAVDWARDVASLGDWAILSMMRHFWTKPNAQGPYRTTVKTWRPKTLLEILNLIGITQDEICDEGWDVYIGGGQWRDDISHHPRSYDANNLRHEMLW